ncbi:MAG: hypothetical protein JO031_04955 [Ktedonobacteraceae bacterium]|nr:hypothetical protein [Ktedonobacteraceae bacterium]
MNEDSHERTTVTLAPTVSLSSNKVKPDLVILKYMAQQLYITLQQPDSADTTTKPLLYSLDDCHQRKQRIALYQPQELLQARHLSFVGFVSGRQHALSPDIVNEIERIDELMVSELLDNSGIFSYSSLEVRPDRWYNLVVFHNAETKTHLKKSHTHAYAVYQLAPHFYEWIRLHNGFMPGGLAQQELLLQSTKYYTFQQGQAHFNMHEITYGC